MASKQVQKTLATLALCEGSADFIDRQYQYRKRNKTMLKLLASLRERSSHALKVWPDTLSNEDVQNLYAKLSKFESTFIKSADDSIIFTTFLLGILDDITTNLSDKTKIEVVQKVILSVKAIHRYFDRTHEKIDCYEKADILISRWNSIMGENIGKVTKYRAIMPRSAFSPLAVNIMRG